MGVWIEIPYKKSKKLVPNGHSLRGSVDWNIVWKAACTSGILVTPCVGVWIEIRSFVVVRCFGIVTPCVGVWIEIIQLSIFDNAFVGHSLRGSVDWNTIFYTGIRTFSCHSLRGSVDWNSLVNEVRENDRNVTPCVGVWIEIGKLRQSLRLWLSLPAWECGLKLKLFTEPIRKSRVTPCVGVWIEIFYRSHGLHLLSWSLPAWECGLKLHGQKMGCDMTVTPCVGVWIEM